MAGVSEHRLTPTDNVRLTTSVYTAVAYFESENMASRGKVTFDNQSKSWYSCPTPRLGYCGACCGDNDDRSAVYDRVSSSLYLLYECRSSPGI